MAIKITEKIIEYIKKNEVSTVAEMTDYFSLSRQIIHRHLKKLVENELIVKIGKPPKVFYSASKKKVPRGDGGDAKDFIYDNNARKIIKDNFMLIEPSGRRLLGVTAFVAWCNKRKYDTEEKAKEYKKIFEKYENIKKRGFIDGIAKIKNSFKEQCIDKVFYIDFYAWEIFGKTKMGQSLLYAKQSQNKKIINELIESIKTKVNKLINLEKIDAVGFIPPTIKREVQFMKILEKKLNLTLPSISIIKIKTDIIVPQKTLSKLEDRIENADSTIIVDEERKFKKILLIDDAVGSGATLNQVACKIKKRGIAGSVVGLAITGSLKGFDVISEI